MIFRLPAPLPMLLLQQPLACAPFSAAVFDLLAAHLPGEAKPYLWLPQAKVVARNKAELNEILVRSTDPSRTPYQPSCIDVAVTQAYNSSSSSAFLLNIIY